MKNHPKKKWLLLAALVFVAALAAQVGFHRYCASRCWRIDDLETRSVRDMDYLPAEPARVLILGDSTAAFNLNASVLKESASLALLNGTMAETFFVLRRYLARKPAPRCVLYALTFRWPGREKTFWNQMVKNGFYSREELGELYELSAARGGFPASEMSAGEYRFRAWLYDAGLAGYSLKNFQDTLLMSREDEARRQDFPHRLRANRGPVAPEAADALEGEATAEPPQPPSPSGLDVWMFRNSADQAANAGATLFLLGPVVSAGLDPAKARALEDSYEKLIRDAGLEGRVTFLRAPRFETRDFAKSGHLLAGAARRLTADLSAPLSTCFR